MRTLLITASLLVPLSAPLFAQAPSQTPGEPAATQTFPAKAHSLREQDAPLALALDLAFGATVWTEVRVSTAGPVGDVTLLVHEGFYKREIIQMIVMSLDARRPLKDVLERRRKGRKLRAIALELGLDPEAEEAAAIAVEQTVDRDFLPRFPEHKLRRFDED